jgi:hypothetical protein
MPQQRTEFTPRGNYIFTLHPFLYFPLISTDLSQKVSTLEVFPNTTYMIMPSEARNVVKVCFFCGLKPNIYTISNIFVPFHTTQ